MIIAADSGLPVDLSQVCKLSFYNLF